MMKPISFIYWLQGFLELSGTESLTKEQVEMIKDHISLVMTKVTPKNVEANDFIDPIEEKERNRNKFDSLIEKLGKDRRFRSSPLRYC